MDVYIPAAIALVGALVGLGAQRQWNWRVEKRDAYAGYLTSVQRMKTVIALTPAEGEPPTLTPWLSDNAVEALAEMVNARSQVELLGGGWVVTGADRIDGLIKARAQPGSDEDNERRDELVEHAIMVYTLFARYDLALWGFRRLKYRKGFKAAKGIEDTLRIAAEAERDGEPAT